MSEILVNNKYNVAILPRAGVAVTTNMKRLPRPTTTVDKISQHYQIMYWGDGNDFPQQVIADVRMDPEIGALLNKKAALLYSSGLIWGIPKIVNGVEVLTPLPDADEKIVKTFLKRTNINRYLAETAKDLYWFANAFTEVVLSGDGKQIIQLCAQASEEVRTGIQNPDTGLIDTCYLNAQWPFGTKYDQFTKVLPMIDPYYDPVQQLVNQNVPKKPEGATNWIKGGLNWIYHLSTPNPGSKFYQLADWNPIRLNGVLALSQLMLQFKQSALNNQMGIKYHIEISSQYWGLKYDGFDTKPPAEQNKLMDDELKAMQDTLVGALNAGKSIRSVIFHDFNQGKEFSLVKITPIEDLMKDGRYIEDGKSASLYKISAIDLHPALIGVVPENGMGGAGSNIREAYNLHMLTISAMQDLLLEPLNNLVIEFNGWNPDMVFKLKNQLMTTLDAGKETKPQN